MSSPLSDTAPSLLDAAWEFVPGGINSARRRTTPPLSIAKAHGAYLTDTHGQRYLDYHQAYGAVVLGHSYPSVIEEVAKGIRDLVLVGVGLTQAELLLAQALVECIPTAEQVILTNSGSEATYNAIRLARAVTGRPRILKFRGCYHGSHDYVLRNGHYSDASTAEPEYGGVLQAAHDSVVVCHYNDLSDVAEAFRRFPDSIAAVIVEPIAHNAPSIMPVAGFLEGLRELCNGHQSLLIFDEVITGFRHGLGGYQAICGVRPDLTTVGKALANGFPIAAVVGPRWLMERFATHPDGDVFLGGTYNGNAVVVLAALATLAVLRSDNVYEHLFALGERMRSGLKRVAETADVPAVVTGFGSLYTLLFTESDLRDVRNLDSADSELFVRYREELLRRGVLEMPVPFVRAQVSFSHTTDDVDLTLEAAEDALRAAITRPRSPL